MTTINLVVSASADDAHQSSIANDSGRTFTSTGSVSLTSTILSPGSHGSNDEYTAGARFLNVTVPNGATISSATFKLTPQATYNAGSNVIKYWVSAQAADNPGTFTTTGGNLNSTNRPRTTAAATWTQTSVTVNVAQSVDITSVIQEIVNRAGWASGNAIVILVDTHADTTTGEWQDYYAYDHTTGQEPQLDITYSSGASPSTADTAAGSTTTAATGASTASATASIAAAVATTAATGSSIAAATAGGSSGVATTAATGSATTTATVTAAAGIATTSVTGASTVVATASSAAGAATTAATGASIAVATTDIAAGVATVTANAVTGASTAVVASGVATTAATGESTALATADTAAGAATVAASSGGVVIATADTAAASAITAAIGASLNAATANSATGGATTAATGAAIATAIADLSAGSTTVSVSGSSIAVAVAQTAQGFAVVAARVLTILAAIDGAYRARAQAWMMRSFVSDWRYGRKYEIIMMRATVHAFVYVAPDSAQIKGVS